MTFGTPLDFRKRYSSATYNGYGWEDGDPSNIAELKNRLTSCYLRRTVSDTSLDIPDLVHSSRIVTMNNVSRRSHDDLLRSTNVEQLVRAILNGQVRDALPILTKLRQATSMGKISSTVELISDIREQEDAIVVFCWSRDVARKIAERTSGICATGDQSIDDRLEIVAEFQRSGGTLVATYGALKESVTLHRARIVILHDLDWVVSSLMQAIQRVARIGQFRACQAIWVLGEGSVDIVLAEALLYKAKLLDEILDIKDGSTALDDISIEDYITDSSFDTRVREILINCEQSL
jgi:SNF2 family DNA or RNA helicase